MSNYFSVSNYLNAHLNLFQNIDVSAFQKGIDLVKDAFINNNKILTCGNGGSAYAASHYITDWNKMINLSTGKKFRGISLCDNIGLITAYANDIAYEEVFAGQISALMDRDDLLIVVSGSGNSRNVIKAIHAAHHAGGKVLGVLGYDGGKVKAMCDHVVLVNSFDMQICEDIHLMFGHMVMKMLCNTSIIT